MMSRFFGYVAALAAGTLFPSVIAAAPPLARLLPEDAAVVISLRKAPDFVASVKTTPLWRMAADEQVLRFFAPLREQLKWDERKVEFAEGAGTTWETLLSWVEGDVMLSLNDFSFLLDPATQETPPVVLALEAGGSASKFADMLQAVTRRRVEAGTATEETETFSGVTLHLVQYRSEAPADASASAAGESDPEPAEASSLVWAVTDGVVLASPDKPAVIGLIDAIKRGGVDAPLERSARWVRLQERAGTPDLAALVHVPAILPTLQETLERRGEGNQAPPFGIDMSSLLSKLGLDAWGDLYLTLKTEPDATVNHYGLTVSEVRGLLQVFSPTEGAFPRPAWIPAQWTSVSTLRFSLKSAYDSLEGLLRSLSPALESLVQGQIGAVNKQLGVDLKRDLIGSFGDEFVQVQFPAGAIAEGGAVVMPEQLYAVSLTNAGEFTRAVEALKKLGGPAMEKLVERRDYLGHTIQTFVRPASATGGGGMSFVVTDRWMLLNVGGPGPIEAALQSMSGQGESFWEKADVRAALASVPDTAVGFQFQDVAVVIASLFDTLATQAALPKPPGADPSAGGAWVTPSEKPSIEHVRRFWGENVNYSLRDAEGFHGVSRLSHPQP